jgi:hypothetical protein
MSIDLSSFLLFHSVSIANLRKGHSSWVLSCSQRERCIPNNIHITLVMLAQAFLAGICATARGSLSLPVVLPLTLPEVRHLLARLIWPAASSTRRVLAWSWWRRCHQSRASYYHTKHRLKTH